MISSNEYFNFFFSQLVAIDKFSSQLLIKLSFSQTFNTTRFIAISVFL